MKKQNVCVSIPIAIGTGGGISLLAALGLTAMLASLITSGHLQPQMMGYGGLVVLAISTLTGVAAACCLYKEKRIFVSTLSSGIFFLILLCITALLFNGVYQGVFATLTVVLGTGLAYALASAGKQKKSGRKYRKRHYG